jgi:hypothetical protein
MRCRKVRSFLSAYCRGETNPGLSAKIAEHLSECSSCRREEAAYKSMNGLIAGLPRQAVAGDFTARLFEKIGQAGFAERKTRAYFPRRIPRFGMARLAAAASVAVIILAMGIGLHLGDTFFAPDGPRMMGPTATNANSANDRYLTAQPEDNPFLNEHKSVSKMVAQYSRWREYSERLRENGGVGQMLGAQNAAFASSQATGGTNTHITVRPVVKDYLIVPE